MAAAIGVVSIGAVAADPRPLNADDMEVGKVAKAIAIVVPKYPPAALQEGVEATIDVFGIVRGNGTFTIERVDSKPPREDFEAAVKQVIPYWLFRPRYDSDCNPKEDTRQLRIWFEIKAGAPSISVSGIAKYAGPIPDDPDPLYKALEKVEPMYPRAALRAGLGGLVEGLARIGDEGDVEAVVIVPGRHTALFGPPVEQALKLWRFPPAKRPIRCASYEFDFRLRD